MVKLHDVRAANEELVKTRDLVCVAAGATSGIGETTLRQLAATSGAQPDAKALRVYIIARRPAVAQELIKELSKSCPKGDFILIQAADMALLKDVDKACDEIMQQERQRAGEKAKIDLVLTTQGYFDPFEARTDTAEGLDSKTSLHFYSRMRMVYRLLPLLIDRLPDTEPAQIISVYAGGMETSGKVFPDDLSLRDPKHYGFANARTTVVHMTTMFFEHLANDYAGKLSLVHVFPGLVVTSTSVEMMTKPHYPFWFRWLAKVSLPIARVTTAVPVPESGQRTLFLATSKFPAYSASDKSKPSATRTGIPVAVSTNGVLGGGAYSCTANCETVDVSKAYAELRPVGFYNKVWAHVMDAFTTIESGEVFTG